MVAASSSIVLPTSWGIFSAQALPDGASTHLLLRYGSIEETRSVLVRIHSCCCFGDVFGGLSCDCRAQLEESIRTIVSDGAGLLFYLQQEGRGAGLRNKIEAIRMEQTLGLDTVEAYSHLNLSLDERSYDIVVRALRAEKIRSVRLLTNNPSKCDALRNAGFVVERKPIETAPTSFSWNYINTKITKMGHLWSSTSESPALAPKSK